MPILRTTLGYLLSIAITLALGEVALRIIDPPRLALKTTEHHLWQRDAELGWKRTPDTKGTFTNGYFTGSVSTDTDSNRSNSVNGTYKENYKNILFIGDSTTASLEVNDDKTVPAILEQSLRDSGKQYNVINLGVRGYGTDQSVLKAIKNAEKYPPTDIIYMFVSNDIYNNNTLKRPNRVFGKSSFVRKKGNNVFNLYNSPVPEYEISKAGLVVLDNECNPHPHITTIEENKETTPISIKNSLKENVYVYRALWYIKKTLLLNSNGITKPRIFREPHDLINSGDFSWHDSFANAYEDNGTTRKRCSEYFDSQIKFLLQKLKAVINTQPRVHLVQFPDTETINLLKNNSTSPNIKAFNKLLSNNIIDTYISLPTIVTKTNIDLTPMRCEGDGHFCEKGNRWIAGILEKNITLPE